jgi:hypothetical protein
VKNLLNFGLFQVVWFVTVLGAARGDAWIGPMAVLLFAAVHLAMVHDRGRELAYLVAVGLTGTVLDSVLMALGVTGYAATPASWPTFLVPPWIVGCWVAFAMLPRFSLSWAARWPLVAAVLGAVGGPLSFYAGLRLGAARFHPVPLVTWIVLGLEYAFLLPLMLRAAPGLQPPGLRSPGLGASGRVRPDERWSSSRAESSATVSGASSQRLFRSAGSALRS